MGVAAFFDFCATVLAPYFPEDDGIQTITTKGLFFDRYHEEYVVTDDPLLHDCLQWLDRWYVHIGIIFSILWFFDAFVKAQWKRDENLDRQRVLNEGGEPSEARSWRAFYCTVAFQLLVLPIGVYVAIWNALRFQWSSEEEIDETVKNGSGIRSTHSLLFACLHYSFTAANRMVGVGIQTQRKVLTKRAAGRLTKFAVRHPRLFRHRLRMTMRTLRWAKYLAPLVGACNKLFGNTMDLLKKHRQRLMAQKESRRRTQRWRELSPIQKRTEAAILVQKSFRGMEARQAVRALNILRGSKKTMVAIRMQKAFRASLARARARILRKKQELKRLQAQAKMYGSAMSDDDRRRMYQLQDELALQAKELINKKLLLRPNTTFAVTWKFLFVICVLFEITQVACKPKLQKYKDAETGKPLNLSRILEINIVPSPVSAWEECAASWTAVGQEHGFLQSAKQRKTKPSPWYCQEPFVALQSFYIHLLRFVITETLLIIGIVCFMDVWVTFFTGELHPENGLLIPKSFFNRWILPGLVLQLLVNPQMETTSKYVGKLLANIIYVGPVRGWRWMAALWYPLLRTLVRVVEIYIWRPLVQQQNQSLQERKARQSVPVEPKHFERHRRKSCVCSSEISSNSTHLAHQKARRRHSS